MRRPVYFHSKEGKGLRQLNPFKKVKGLHIRLGLRLHLCIPAEQRSGSHFRLLHQVDQQVTGYTQMFCANSHKLLVKSHLFLLLPPPLPLSFFFSLVSFVFSSAPPSGLYLLRKPGWSNLLPFVCAGCTQACLSPEHIYTIPADIFSLLPMHV